jgi:serine/threonine-protein kinase HipA
LRSLEYVLQAAETVERGEPVPAQLDDLLAAGPSAGGARPKASVRDADGVLWLAKFPSRTDTFDVALAEFCTLELARRCGLTVPALRHLDFGRRSVMLIERFDRKWLTPAPDKDGTGPAPQPVELRVPFVSGLTLMGISEQESRVSGYAGLALAIRARGHPDRIRADREELFMRMVFNIFVSNDDDHLRNHGFLRSLELGGWTLSPLYDVVPRPGVAHERFLHLQVGAQGKLATLDNALSEWQAFVGSRPRAVELMHRVWMQLREWRTTFEEFDATGQLIEQLAPAIRELEHIASSALQAEIRRCGPSDAPASAPRENSLHVRR